MECNRIPASEKWNEASAIQIQEYRNHIKFCLACRRRVFSESPEHLLFELQGEPMPDDFWIGFWDSIEYKLPAQKRYHLPLLPVMRWAAALIVALLLALYQNHLPESPSYEITRGGFPIRPFDLSASASQYPLIEEVQDPGSTYYIFESAADEKIVMIYDPDMEL